MIVIGFEILQIFSFQNIASKTKYIPNVDIHPLTSDLFFDRGLDVCLSVHLTGSSPIEIILRFAVELRDRKFYRTV